MGARLSLAVYLMERCRNQEALQLFESREYKDTFFGVEYLHSLVLIRLGRLEEASLVLLGCLRYHPHVARFILEPVREPPDNESRFGVASGSPYEGWFHARDFGDLWASDRTAMKLLRKEAKAFQGNFARQASGKGHHVPPSASSNGSP